MNIFRLTSLLAALALSQSCTAEPSPPDTSKVEASSTDERAERNIIIDAVSEAINTNDFAALNRMSDHYRTTRARTPSGMWKLGIFHATLQYDLVGNLSRKSGCVPRNAKFVRKWQDFDPDQPAAIITAADLQLARGWCARGSGYANEVTEPQWESFRKATQAAVGILEANRAKASTDPEFYAVMASAYRASSKSWSALDDLLEEATAREPYYHRTYFKAAFSYLPQWGGSADDLDDFARFAAVKTRTSDKTGFYARVYWWLEDCDCASRIDAGHWDDMKQSMRDIYERYPVDFNAQNMLNVSCKAGDVDEALYYMRALYPDATSDADFAAMIASCKSAPARV